MSRVGGTTSGKIVVGTSQVSGSNPLPVSGSGSSGGATEATLLTRLSESDFDTKIGSLTETAPASDTASSGLNGRLQRIAQRITSLISAVGSPFQAGGSIGNTTFASTQSGTWTVQPGNTPNTTAWKVDGSAVTQPVSGTITANPTSPATILNGQKLVTTAGTRVTLASSTTIKSVTIKALSTNTGIVYVGNATVSSSNGLQLVAGDSVSLDISNLATINLDASVSGEGATYLGVV